MWLKFFTYYLGLIDKRIAGFAFFLFYCAMTYVMLRRAKAGLPIPAVRKIAGLDAIDEAIGRATEMGRPGHYTLGLGAMSSTRSFAAYAVLGHVAKVSARYDTRLIITHTSYLMQAVLEEIVKTAHLEVGRPDSYNPDDVRYLSGYQFAYAAGVSGILHRERCAANFMFGEFMAESLIIAEAGHDAGAIQVAGATNTAQLPYFVAVCDYTLIGEELYASGSYLSKEPILLGTVAAQDIGKLAIMAFIIIGTVLQTLGAKWFAELFKH